ncbi:hypothetical protein N8652_00575 [bacterium]|nr:hypothetical protein [bacterium]
MAAFHRSVAHDLRSPLTALIWIAQLMEFGPEHRTDENIATLTESATRMRSTIDSLLLFAQVGHAEIEIDPIKMRDLAE